MGKYFRVILYTGLAMFSMFFGAGNVVFPLDLGRVAGDMNFYAVSGLLLTAVLVPFAGLFAMFMFEGDYRTFFERMGKVPGYLIVAFLMMLIGPFMAIPRCITLSFSTLKMYMPGVSLFYFSIAACAAIFFLTVNRRKVLHLLGHVLSPLLLGSLIVLIIIGFIAHPPAAVKLYSRSKMFFYGLNEGYFTMDLLGAFFFSVVVLLGLKRSLGYDVDKVVTKDRKKFFTITITSSLIGAFLLAVIYVCFSYVASFYSIILRNVEKDTVLSILSSTILGFGGGIVANVAVSLACLTTAMTLSAVFSEFIQNEFFRQLIGYKSSLLITLVAAFAMSNLGFVGIIKMSTPILVVIYPVLIVLTLLNIAKELWGFRPVKIPVLITFIISLIFYLVK